MAKNNKTRFFYVLYSDKTRVFDQSERAYYPIYIINIYIYRERESKDVGQRSVVATLSFTPVGDLQATDRSNLL